MNIIDGGYNSNSDFDNDEDIQDPLDGNSIQLYEGLDFYGVNDNITRFRNSERHIFYSSTFQSENTEVLISCIKRFLYRSESSYLNRKPLIIVRAIGQLWKQRESDLENLYNHKYSNSDLPIKDAVEGEVALMEWNYEDQSDDDVYNGENIIFKYMRTICDSVNLTQDAKRRLIKTWFILHNLSKFVVNYYEERFAKKFFRETYYFDDFKVELNNSLSDMEQDFGN